MQNINSQHFISDRKDAIELLSVKQARNNILNPSAVEGNTVFVPTHETLIMKRLLNFLGEANRPE
jgi:hypothetical protein